MSLIHLRTLFPILGFVALLGCASEQGTSPEVDPAAERRLRADIGFLAADELEGRGTPGPGLELAALYLESQLQAAGVEPAVDGSYRQTYTIGSYNPARARVSVRIRGRQIQPDDYVLIDFGRDPAKGPINLPLVAAGHGIVAEERNTDDLSALDVRGKAVVARKGASWALEPASVFGPDRAMGKLMAATVRGAELLVYLSDELDTGKEAEAAFFAQMKHAGVGFVRDENLRHASALNPLLIIKPAAFHGALGKKEFTPGPLEANIEIRIDAHVEEGQASNILGKIEGTDARLREEWLVLTAHYDHIGSHQVPRGQDGIWNGADDNASGTAAILEITRGLARSRGKRSVLVFFTSGEDRGLFGSAYYSTRPAVPMDRVIAQLNLDMVGRSMGTVQGIAPTAPGLFHQAVELGQAVRMQVTPDQQPLWRVLYLTDNYHFARAGVPGIHFFTGVHPDYHQPSDTADKIRYPELSKIVTIAGEMARRLADGQPKPQFERPEWFVTPE